MALSTLAGKPWRGVADLWHLWHPPQDRENRRIGSRESWNLRRRYLKARSDPAAMRRLVEEGRQVARNAHQQAVRDRLSVPV